MSYTGYTVYVLIDFALLNLGVNVTLIKMDDNKSSTNKRNRSFINGQAVGNDLRSLVVTHILEIGGNTDTGYIPRGVISNVASQLRLSNNCVKNIWDRYCDTGSVKPRPHSGGKEVKLKEPDVMYIEQLKREKPSVYLNEIQDKLARFSNVDVSTSTICKTLKRKMKDGQWTRKVMVVPSKERFTPNNMQYTQAFLNYISRQNPYKLKFFDESGFNMPDSIRRKYGHAPLGKPAVEVASKGRSPHYTLNLMLGLNGIAYANVVEGATDTTRYLNFFHEASNSVDDYGNPALVAGDIVIVDNCATHRNRGQLILGQYLQNQGITYTFTPTYSPDLNPVEHCFRHIKILMKTDKFRRMATEVNLECAILSAVLEINAGDAKSYFAECGYMNIN